jgi:threonine synthase
MAKELGIRKLAMPSAGNAGGALAAYAAQAGLEVAIYMPEETPAANRQECILLGAKVVLVPGSIKDCGRAMREQLQAGRSCAPAGGHPETVNCHSERSEESRSAAGVSWEKDQGEIPRFARNDSQFQGREWFDVSTLREPYRLEGKKTMAYEVVEQLGGRVPHAMIYPTGGGTGLIGMWKAFAEMEELGWTDGHRPRMFAVQAQGCAPIARAFAQGSDQAEEWENPQTIASGLRVPSAIGDFMMLRALRESGGAALAVSDSEMLVAMRELAETEGILTSPEGGATLAALKKLLGEGFLAGHEGIILFLTASGYKYQEVLETLSATNAPA